MTAATIPWLPGQLPEFEPTHLITITEDKMTPDDPSYDFGVDPIQLTNDKVKKLLAAAYERLSPADKVLAAFKPGIMCHTNGEEVSFILEATGEVIALASRAWLADDDDTEFRPEWIPTDDLDPSQFT
jgi:hypothetical protein